MQSAQKPKQSLSSSRSSIQSALPSAYCFEPHKTSTEKIECFNENLQRLLTQCMRPKPHCVSHDQGLELIYLLIAGANITDTFFETDGYVKANPLVVYEVHEILFRLTNADVILKLIDSVLHRNTFHSLKSYDYTQTLFTPIIERAKKINSSRENRNIYINHLSYSTFNVIHPDTTVPLNQGVLTFGVPDSAYCFSLYETSLERTQCFNKHLKRLFNTNCMFPIPKCVHSLEVTELKYLLVAGTKISDVFCGKSSYLPVNSYRFYGLSDALFYYAGPDVVLEFAIFILYSSYLYNNDHSSLLKLFIPIIEKTINSGANVNRLYSGQTVLELAEDPEIIKLLKSKGAQCGWELNNESHVLLRQLRKLGNDRNRFCSSLYKNLNAPPASESKIERNIHYIWLTDEARPQDLKKEDVLHLKEMFKLFSRDGNVWRFFMWTNAKGLLQSMVELESFGIEVRSIYDYRYTLSPVWDLISYQIEHRIWGAIPIRLAVVLFFGGWYADIDRIFIRSLYEESLRFDFSGFRIYELGLISDNYFGARTGHPILYESVNWVRDFLSNPNGCKHHREETTQRLFHAIKKGYKKAANINTTDILYPEDNREFEDNANREELYNKTTNVPIRLHVADDKCLHSKDLNKYANSQFNECEEFNICAAPVLLTGYDPADKATWLHN